MIGVIGLRTTIIQCLKKYDDVYRLDGMRELLDDDYIVLAGGLLFQKPHLKQTDLEKWESIQANLLTPMTTADQILAIRPNVRICIVGSESGFKGSYDETYAVAKAGIHAYVKTKRLKENQSLFAVAPHIIIDSGMTRRRKDYHEIKKQHETKPFITAQEVADVIWEHLQAGTRNEVIRLSRI